MFVVHLHGVQEYHEEILDILGYVESREEFEQFIKTEYLEKGAEVGDVEEHYFGRGSYHYEFKMKPHWMKVVMMPVKKLV